MSSVTVNIVFHGLLAFSPHYDGEMANHMSALAVDSRQAPQNSVCLVEHMAMIEFPASSADCTASPASGCDWSGGRCTCPLDRQEVQLIPDADPALSRLSRERPENPLPATNASHSAGDFSYVAHLSNLGYTLDPRYHDAVPPAALAARFTFPFDSLLACDLATRPDDLSDNVHSFQFRELGTRGGPDQLHQAIAQSLVATVSLDTSTQAPLLRLREFGSSVHQDFPLIVNPSSGIKIEVMNHRPYILPLGDPCDDGIGRDFALFYELVQNPPAWPQRQLPHVKFTSWKPQSEVEPVACEIAKLPQSRPVCPVVAF